MPIFIAKDYESNVLDVVLAKSYELANAFWHGRGVYPHFVDSRTENDLVGHPTGVLPIVQTKEVHSGYIGHGKTLRVIK